MNEGILIITAMLTGVGVGGWWTSRIMRYNQAALTQAVTLAGEIAKTQMNIINDLRDQQRGLINAVLPKPKKVKAEATDMLPWTPTVKPSNGQHLEGPPPNIRAGRIEV